MTVDASPAFRIAAVINILCCNKLSEDEEEEKEAEEASVPSFFCFFWGGADGGSPSGEFLLTARGAGCAADGPSHSK